MYIFGRQRHTWRAGGQSGDTKYSAHYISMGHRLMVTANWRAESA